MSTMVMHGKQMPQPTPVSVLGEDRRGTWVIGTPVPPQAHPANQQAATWIAVEYIPSIAANHTYMNNYSAPLPELATTHTAHGLAMSTNTNPYVQVSPVPGSSGKGPMDMMLKVLNRCGKKLEVTARKAGDTAGNVWNHLRTGPSITDAAMSRLAQGTKVLAEGGRDKVFLQTFTTLPGEQLKKSYACYLSTSSGPVIGTLYITTARLAFCSDNPLCQNVAPGQLEWVFYKVVVQIDQLKAANPSSNSRNPAEKYIQIVTADNHEFWFMGFLSYDKALKHLTEALKHSSYYK
ncbi:GEM-like protein 1 isoform X2 [Dioscorea cayenensis subsp. rotundata]|uniref:GEM-like protein 1 isoform X2 n=1 Tax=Dioscorea cayennensis subsp. rotundata TaxID=55577 RepID=A0AB40AH16_DIOCR|nr:GEM-like protein 1 isoform X2 [Dioscorea cayenensis subsp. rotundata]